MRRMRRSRGIWSRDRNETIAHGCCCPVAQSLCWCCTSMQLRALLPFAMRVVASEWSVSKPLTLLPRFQKFPVQYHVKPELPGITGGKTDKEQMHKSISRGSRVQNQHVCDILNRLNPRSLYSLYELRLWLGN